MQRHVDIIADSVDRYLFMVGNQILNKYTITFNGILEVLNFSKDRNLAYVMCCLTM